MADKTWNHRLNASADSLRSIADEIMKTSCALEEVGNDKLSVGLYWKATRIREHADVVDKMVREALDAQARTAEEASARVYRLFESTTDLGKGGI